MRKLLAGLIAVVAIVASIVGVRAGFLINSYSVRPYQLEFLTTLTWSSGTTITGSVDIGPVNATKEIFIVSGVAGSSSPTLTAATTTVNAVAVTKNTTSLSATSNELSGARVSVPTAGGSVTITATYSGTLTSGVVGIYRVLNRPGIGANESDGSSATAASGTSIALNATTIGDNGIWLGLALHANNNATTSPTGTTADVDVNIGANRINIASRPVQITGSTPTDTWSWTTSVANRAVSWAFN